MGLRLSGDLAQYTMYYYCKHKRIYFIKAPPLTPATLRQVRQRNRFRLVAMLWRSMKPSHRQAWNDAATLARLRISGYNLYLYWSIRHDDASLAAISRHSGIPLPPTN